MDPRPLALSEAAPRGVCLNEGRTQRMRKALPSALRVCEWYIHRFADEQMIAEGEKRIGFRNPDRWERNVLIGGFSSDLVAYCGSLVA